jgi:hypothetical protein
MTTNRKIALCAAVAVVILGALVVPWITIHNFYTETVRGINGVGWLVAIPAVFTLLPLTSAPDAFRNGFRAAVATFVAGLIAMVASNGKMSAATNDGVSFDTGPGLGLVLWGSVVILVIYWRARPKKATES